MMRIGPGLQVLTGTVCCNRRAGKRTSMVMRGRVWFWFDEFGGSLFPFSIFLAIVSEWGTRVETKESFTPRRSSSVQQDGPASGGLSRATSISDPFQLYRRITDFTSWNAQDDWMTDLWKYPEPQLITDKGEGNVEQ